MPIDPNVPCNEKTREHASWVDCEGEVARRVKPCNTEEDPLYVSVVNQGGGGNGLKCLKDVINLTANIPLIIALPSISSICSHELCDGLGNAIYLSTEIVGNQITLCSKQDLTNILYKIIGE